MGGVSSTTYTGDLEDVPFTSLPNPIFTRGKPLSNHSRKRLPASESHRRRRSRSGQHRRSEASLPVADDADVSTPPVPSEMSQRGSSHQPARHMPPSLADRSDDTGTRALRRLPRLSSGASSRRPQPSSADDGEEDGAERQHTGEGASTRTRATECQPHNRADDDALVRRGAELFGNNADDITEDPALDDARPARRHAAAAVHHDALVTADESPPSPAPPSHTFLSPREHRSAPPPAMTMATATQHAPYGDLIPWGDPAWYRGEFTPYYTASHVKWRARVREFVEREITPNAHEWDENKAMPKAIFRQAAEAGLLACTVGVPWPTEYAGPGPEGFDYFHELILIDELSRCGSGGVVWGLFGGLSIGLPPVVNFASKALRDRVVPECLSGNKVICLAISEPYAGSDVANLKCTADKTPDGRHFIVNGEKKWITNGVFADYFTVAVRTGGKGAGGLSLLLIEREMPGITTQQMKCTGVWPSGTAYITFDDVKVPVENLIGAENQGFKFIMYNFNHERWSLIAQASRFARVCLEESFKFASKRATFGKKLLEHPVIRWKIAEMARQVEATHAQLESLTLQMNLMNKREAMEQLGGPLALLKVQSTKVFEYCAREAAQIFGGSSYVRGGQGEKVERLYREVRAYAIPGGSEEIMLDLAVRQAMKQAQGTQSKM